LGLLKRPKNYFNHLPKRKWAPKTKWAATTRKVKKSLKKSLGKTPGKNGLRCPREKGPVHKPKKGERPSPGFPNAPRKNKGPNTRDKCLGTPVLKRKKTPKSFGPFLGKIGIGQGFETLGPFFWEKGFWPA